MLDDYDVMSGYNFDDFHGTSGWVDDYPTCHCPSCMSEGRIPDDPACLYRWAHAFAVDKGASPDVAEAFDSYVREYGRTRPRVTSVMWARFLTDSAWHDADITEEITRLRDEPRTPCGYRED